MEMTHLLLVVEITVVSDGMASGTNKIIDGWHGASQRWCWAWDDSLFSVSLRKSFGSRLDLGPLGHACAFEVSEVRQSLAKRRNLLRVR